MISMQGLAPFLATLRRNGVRLWLENDQVRYQDRSGFLTAERLAELRRLKPEILDLLRAEPGRTDASPLQVHACSRSGPLRTTTSQQIYAHRYATFKRPERGHLMFGLRIDGPLHFAALQAALERLIDRHAALRTEFERQGEDELSARVRERAEVVIRNAKIFRWGRRWQRFRLRRLAKRLARPRFNLRKCPLFRVLLIRLGAQEHVLVLVFHHIVFDGWSMAIVINELSELYDAMSTGRQPLLVDLDLQFSDFAECQVRWLAGEDGRRHVEYWKRRLAGPYAPFWIPQDRLSWFARKAEERRIMLELPSSLVDGMRRLALRSGCSPWVVAMACFCAVLCRWTGQPNVYVVVTHSGRTSPSLYGLIGCFYDCWILHMSLSDSASFTDVLQRVKDRYHEALPHLDVPALEMMKHLPLATRDRRSAPVSFNYIPHFVSNESFGAACSDPMADSAAASTRRAGQRRMRAIPLGARRDRAVADRTPRKLHIELAETEDALRVTICYAADFFHARTIEWFSRSFQQLLAASIENPERRVGDLLGGCAPPRRSSSASCGEKAS